MDTSAQYTQYVRQLDYTIDKEISPDDEEIGLVNYMVKEAVHELLKSEIQAGHDLSTEEFQNQLAGKIREVVDQLSVSADLVNPGTVAAAIVKTIGVARERLQIDKPADSKPMPAVTRAQRSLARKSTKIGLGAQQALRQKDKATARRLKKEFAKNAELLAKGEISADVVKQNIRDICELVKQDPEHGGEMLGSILGSYDCACDKAERNRDPAVQSLKDAVTSTLKEQYNEGGMAIRLPFYFIATYEAGAINGSPDLRSLFTDLTPRSTAFAPIQEAVEQAKASPSSENLDALQAQVAELGALMAKMPSDSTNIFRHMVYAIEEAAKESSQAPFIRGAMIAGLNEALAKLSAASLRDDLRLLFHLDKIGVIDDISRYPDRVSVMEEIRVGLKLDYGSRVGTTSDPSKAALMFHARPHKSSGRTALSSVGEVGVALDIGLRKLRETHGDDPVFPVFIGTKWHFQAGNAFEMQTQLDQLAELSARYPNVLLIPGSIGWSDQTDEFWDNRVAFNSLPVFKGGRLVNLYHKTQEKQDIDTISRGVDKDFYEWGPSSEMFGRVVRDFNSNHTQLDGVVIGHEICNDHVHSTAQAAYERRHPDGAGADMHLLMAHGSQPNPQRVEVAEGGTFAYIDHSDKARSRMGVVQTGEHDLKKWRPMDGEGSAPIDEVNQNESLLGAFKTHTPPQLTSLSPTFTSIPDDCTLVGEGSDALFKAVAQQVGISSEELRMKLASHLSENSEDYFQSPVGMFPPSISAPVAFHRQMYRRYTFESQLAVNDTVTKLRAGMDPGISAEVLPQLLSDALQLDIKIHQDLASAPTTYATFDRSKPTSIEDVPIVIGYSFENNSFYTTDHTVDLRRPLTEIQPTRHKQTPKPKPVAAPARTSPTRTSRRQDDWFSVDVAPRKGVKAKHKKGADSFIKAMKRKRRFGGAFRRIRVTRKGKVKAKFRPFSFGPNLNTLSESVHKTYEKLYKDGRKPETDEQLQKALQSLIKQYQRSILPSRQRFYRELIVLYNQTYPD